MGSAALAVGETSLVTFTFSGRHRLKALSGAADQALHDWQWQ